MLDTVLGATLRAVLGTCRQLCGESGAPLVLHARAGICGRRSDRSGDADVCCRGVRACAGVCEAGVRLPLLCVRGVASRCCGVGDPAVVPDRSSSGAGGVNADCSWLSAPLPEKCAKYKPLRRRLAAWLKPFALLLPKKASMSRLRLAPGVDERHESDRAGSCLLLSSAPSTMSQHISLYSGLGAMLPIKYSCMHDNGKVN